MRISQVKFGEVIHHIPSDTYARVIGLRSIGDKICIEINRIFKSSTTDGSIREWTVAEHVVWDPDECETQTTREKGEEGSVYYFMEQELALEREI